MSKPDDNQALKTLKNTYEERGIEKGRALAKEALRAAHDGGWAMRDLVQTAAVDPVREAISELRCTLTHIVACGQMPVSLRVLAKVLEVDQRKLGDDIQAIKIAYNALLRFYPDDKETARRVEQEIAEIIDTVNPYDSACSAVARGDDTPLRQLSREKLPKFETLTNELQKMSVGRKTDPETLYLYRQGQQLKYVENRTWEEAAAELTRRLSAEQPKRESTEFNVLMSLTQGEGDPATYFKEAYFRIAKKAY